MGALYAAIVCALAAGAVGMLGAPTFGAGPPWLVGGLVLALMAGLCLLEWPDAAGGYGLAPAALVAAGALMLGAFGSILLDHAAQEVWSSKVPFVGGVASFVMLLGAGWRGR